MTCLQQVELAYFRTDNHRPKKHTHTHKNRPRFVVASGRSKNYLFPDVFFGRVQLKIQSLRKLYWGGGISGIISFELLILICQSWHFYLAENHKFPRSFTTFQDLLRGRFGPLKTYSDVKFRVQPKLIWMILSRETITKKPFKKVVESR